jgi:hypothetical protein
MSLRRASDNAVAPLRSYTADDVDHVWRADDDLGDPVGGEGVTGPPMPSSAGEHASSVRKG